MSEAVGRKMPWTFWAGLLWMLICGGLLWADVVLSDRGAIRDAAEMTAVLNQSPQTLLGMAGRFVAVNMTPLIWAGYVVFLEGVLTWQTGGSPIRRRPHHAACLALASVFIWCVFDAINFNRGMRAWFYLGMPSSFVHRAMGYLFAFAAIVPGMLMSGQVLLNAGLFDWARTRPWRMPRWAKWSVLIVGAMMLLWPLTHPNPVANLTLWTSLVFFLDPINLKLRRPSVFGDWQSGWFGRTLAAFAGGLICGLLWELWNYYALAKWTYHLPFLGSWEQYRYFEMPLIGLIGFIPFGLECWVMWQTLRLLLDHVVEPLPGERDLL